MSTQKHIFLSLITCIGIVIIGFILITRFLIVDHIDQENHVLKIDKEFQQVLEVVCPTPKPMIEEPYHFEREDQRDPFRPPLTPKIPESVSDVEEHTRLFHIIRSFFSMPKLVFQLASRPLGGFPQLVFQSVSRLVFNPLFGLFGNLHRFYENLEPTYERRDPWGADYGDRYLIK